MVDIATIFLTSVKMLQNVPHFGTFRFLSKIKVTNLIQSIVLVYYPNFYDYIKSSKFDPCSKPVLTQGHIRIKMDLINFDNKLVSLLSPFLNHCNNIKELFLLRVINALLVVGWGKILISWKNIYPWSRLVLGLEVLTSFESLVGLGLVCFEHPSSYPGPGSTVFQKKTSPCSGFGLSSF